LLVSTLSTDHPEVLPIEDDDIITEEIAEGDVVTAIQPELFSCQRVDHQLEFFRRQIGFLL